MREFSINSFKIWYSFKDDKKALFSKPWMKDSWRVGIPGTMALSRSINLGRFFYPVIHIDS